MIHKIFEFGVDELVEFNNSAEVSDLNSVYAKGMLAYQRGDLLTLQNSIFDLQTLKQKESTHDFTLAMRCLSLRYKIRSLKIDLNDLQTSADLFDSSSVWSGELAVLLGMGYSQLENRQEALKWFELSAREFLNKGCFRKHLKAMLNVVATRSHIDPNRNLIADYHDLYRLSIKRKTIELSVAITCLINISREYQIIGCHLASLKYVNLAVRHCETQFGSLNHYLALCQRAHVLFEMERRNEAMIDVEMAKASTFPEVKSAINTLLKLMEIEGRNSTNSSRFSDLENTLLRLLNKPRDKAELVDILYGTRIEYDVRINRFKSLLSCIRKKSPGLITFENGKYKISDYIFVPVNKKSG